MQLLRRKRKGSESHAATTAIAAADDRWEISSSSQKSRQKLPRSLSIIGSHFSLEACSRQRKKCKEREGEEKCSRQGKKCKNREVVTAPPCGSSSSNLGRGLKRKIGCIDAATKIGRKKKIEREYILGAEIGTGKFGSVRLCRSKTNRVDYACKTLRKGEETVHREVEIMQHLSGHPGVVTLKAVYEDSENFHLVMELCSGGRLIDQIVNDGNCSEFKAANILKELVLVIQYCHEMGVVHRDVKPENILLTTAGKMKLADFGLATRISNGQTLSGVVGSPAYVAPEVLVGDYSDKVDIWSAGVLLHLLLVGTLPFRGDSLDAVFEAIKMVKLDFNTGLWQPISVMARDLIGRMLTRNVSERITADEILRHRWVVFNTEQMLKTVSGKSKMRNHVGGASSCQSERSSRVTTSVVSHSYDSDPTSLTSSLSRTSEEQEDDCGLVDALAVAISRVRISEPKRTRLCVPSNPSRQDSSLTIKQGNLCTAF